MPSITFWCDEETNEASDSDSPYFLVYAGDGQRLKSDVRGVRRESWDDNVDAGEGPRSASFNFSSEVGTADLVLIALLEEDWDPDANLGNNVQNWMNNLDGSLQVFRTGSSNGVAAIFREEFIKAIKRFSDNDDLIDVHRFASGTTRHFFGGGGHYRVRYVA